MTKTTTTMTPRYERIGGVVREIPRCATCLCDIREDGTCPEGCRQSRRQRPTRMPDLTPSPKRVPSVTLSPGFRRVLPRRPARFKFTEIQTRPHPNRRPRPRPVPPAVLYYDGEVIVDAKNGVMTLDVVDHGHYVLRGVRQPDGRFVGKHRDADCEASASWHRVGPRRWEGSWHEMGDGMYQFEIELLN